MKVGIIGLLASLGSIFACMWDLNHSIEGGWLEYGSWTGVFYTLFIQTSITILSVYLGGAIKYRFKRN